MSASFFSLSFPSKEGLVYKKVGKASQVVLVVKNPLTKARDTGLIPGSRRAPWRAWQPTPVFMPGKFHGQRSLVGYSLRVGKSLTGLKRLSMHRQGRSQQASAGWPVWGPLLPTLGPFGR